MIAGRRLCGRVGGIKNESSGLTASVGIDRQGDMAVWDCWLCWNPEKWMTKIDGVGHQDGPSFGFVQVGLNFVVNGPNCKTRGSGVVENLHVGNDPRVTLMGACRTTALRILMTGIGPRVARGSILSKPFIWTAKRGLVTKLT